MLNFLIVFGASLSALLMVLELIALFVPLALVAKTYDAFGAVHNKRMGIIRFVVILLLPGLWLFYIKRPLHKEFSKDPRERSYQSVLSILPFTSFFFTSGGIACNVMAYLAMIIGNTGKMYGFLIISTILSNGVSLLIVYVYSAALKHYNISKTTLMFMLVGAFVHKVACFLFVINGLSQVEGVLYGGSDIDHETMAKTKMMKNKWWVRKQSQLVFKDPNDSDLKRASDSTGRSVAGLATNQAHISRATSPVIMSALTGPSVSVNAGLQSVLNSDSSTQE